MVPLPGTLQVFDDKPLYVSQAQRRGMRIKLHQLIILILIRLAVRVGCGIVISLLDLSLAIHDETYNEILNCLANPRT